jgi:UTP--glucose-1-phosphate uridylyltransferase
MPEDALSELPELDELAALQDVDVNELRVLIQQLRAGSIPEVSAPSAAAVSPLSSEDVQPLPVPGTPLYQECVEWGEEVLRRGAVACAVLAGGAGTRFGGAVKALVPVTEGRTFLDYKLADAQRIADRYGKPVPVAVMTSALTHDEMAAHLSRAGRSEVLLFKQRMLPRFTPELELFRDQQGQLSLAPAGHGDFFRALRAGVGPHLKRAGVELLYFSNVDNLAATLSPLVIGAHLRLGEKMTVEVTARRNPGTGALDTGAAPVRMDGQLRLVEKVNAEEHPFISTNNLTFHLAPLLELHLPLPYRLVRKKVEERWALQLEQVTGEVTGLTDEGQRPLLPAAFLEVPRRNARDSRFEPVKSPEDLPWVAARLPEFMGRDA